MSRTNLSQITKTIKGNACGRVVEIEETVLYLTDATTTFRFCFNGRLLLKKGDIVQIEYRKKQKDYLIQQYQVLTSCIDDPGCNACSAFRKLTDQNHQLFEILKRKQLFFHQIRNFFMQQDFMEIHTPTLVESPGLENYLEFFQTSYIDYNNQKIKYYLPSSPEYSLKEALTSGLEKIFEIAKVFRNYGENSALHRPEFFMLEWYRAYTDYHVIMQDCEDLLCFLVKRLYPNQCSGNGKKLPFKTGKIKKIRLADLFLEHQINLDDFMENESKFRSSILDYFNLKDNHLTRDDLFFKFFLTEIEPHLGINQPEIVYDYPLAMTPLSRPSQDHPAYGERFELFINGTELANAYGELTDAGEQKKRLEKIRQKRKKLHYSSLALPHRFIQALKYGLPPCSGIALGVERLFMLLENLEQINQTSLFNFP